MKKQRQTRKVTPTKGSSISDQEANSQAPSSAFVEEQYEMVMLPEYKMSDDIPVSPSSLPAVSHDILMLLSTYIDGELSHDPERLNYVEYLLDSRADVREAFSRLKQLQNTVSHVAELTYEEMHATMPDCWTTISEQLDADDDFCNELAIHGETASPEFLSSYYDSEVPRKSPGLKAFEAQLGHDAKATKTLGDWLALSQLLKGFINRLEEACGVDMTDSIMSRLRQDDAVAADSSKAYADTHEPKIAEPVQAVDAAQAQNTTHAVRPKREQGRTLLSPETGEMLSAYFDNDALSLREKAQATKLMETKENCRQFAIFHQQLREGIQRIVKTQEEEAPHILPSIKSKIFADFPGQKQQRGTFPIPKKWLTLTSIAASIMLVIIAGISSLGFNGFQFDQSPSKAPAIQQSAQVAALSAPAVPQEEASTMDNADEHRTSRASRHYRSSRHSVASASGGNNASGQDKESEGVPFALPGGGFTTNAPSYIIHANQPAPAATPVASAPVDGNGITYVSNHNGAGTRPAYSASARTQGPSVALRSTQLRESRVANRVPNSETYLIETLQEEQRHSNQDDVNVLYDL